MNFSPLQNFKKEDFFLNPIPHIVIKNALPEELYTELRNTYPANKFNFSNQSLARNDFETLSPNNVILNVPHEEIQKNKEVSELWKNFMLFFKSKEFCFQVFDIFAKSIVDAYPNFFENKDELHSLSVGQPDSKSGGNSADLFPYAMVMYNTPVKKKSRPRRSDGRALQIHPDAPNKLITGLIYFRDEDDTSVGGDLVIYKWRISLPFFMKKIVIAKRDNFLNSIIRKLHPLFIEEAVKVKYSSNTFVMFVGSIDSLHSVSPRGVTKNIRKTIHVGIPYKKQHWDPYSIIDKVFNFKNYKFLQFLWSKKKPNVK